MEDAILKDEILSALEWEPDIDLAATGVLVTEGLVTVFGHVNTPAQRYAVERAVLGVRGVAVVTNEIEVAASRSGSRPRTD
jgi:osmotically-inducible protein OsmY